MCGVKGDRYSDGCSRQGAVIKRVCLFVLVYICTMFNAGLGNQRTFKYTHSCGGCAPQLAVHDRLAFPRDVF